MKRTRSRAARIAAAVAVAGIAAGSSVVLATPASAAGVPPVTKAGPTYGCIVLLNLPVCIPTL